jgi:methionyl-tRNA formyltransferase
MVLGARLVVKTIRAIAGGSANATDQHFLQTSETLKNAPKIFKSDCRIKWDQDALTIYNFIRGLSPSPTAWSRIINANGEINTVRIFYGTIINRAHCHDYGAIETDGKTYLSVAVRNGFINIEKIQQEGKRQMGIAEFLRGFPQPKDCTFL